MKVGGWSRDPVVERGGLNLYGFVGNDSVQKADRLGLQFAPPGHEVWGMKLTPTPCCADECDDEGDIDWFRTQPATIPGNWTPETPDFIKLMKKAIKKACRGRGRYAKESAEVASDLGVSAVQNHSVNQYGVRLYTVLSYRICMKSSCHGFKKLQTTCGPLHWSTETPTEPRECRPTPSQSHPNNPEAFATPEVAAEAVEQCASDHADEAGLQRTVDE